MTTFSVAINDPNNQYSAYTSQVSACVTAAANLWGSYIQGLGNISIQVNFASLGSGVLANAGSTTTQFQGTQGGVNIFQQGATYEILTGTDPNGSTSDITVNVSTNFLSQFFFDPSFTNTVPSGSTDFMSVILHELGHAFCFNGFRTSTGSLPSNGSGLYGSPYDLNVSVSNGNAYFSGVNERIVYGSGVLLAGVDNTAHLGISDLMAPAMATGDRIGISDLDIAIAQDSGMPIATARADYITLIQGNDYLSAGAGNDTVSSGDGNDSIAGGAGNDAISLGAGDDVGLGNQDDDSILGNLGSDIVVGGQGSDVLVGGQGSDLILGNEGNDIIYGNEANDSISGGQGQDLLIGGQGNDVLYGNEQADTLWGNEGADRFVFGTGSGADRIEDFNFGQGDRLDLQGQTYTTGSSGGFVTLTLSGGGTILLTGVTTFQTDYVA